MTLNEFKIKAAEEYKKEEEAYNRKHGTIFLIGTGIMVFLILSIYIARTKDFGAESLAMVALMIFIYVIMLYFITNNKRKSICLPEDISVYEAQCTGKYIDDETGRRYIYFKINGDDYNNSLQVSLGEYESYKDGHKLVCAKMGKRKRAEYIVWPRNRVVVDSFDRIHG